MNINAKNELPNHVTERQSKRFSFLFANCNAEHMCDNETAEQHRDLAIARAASSLTCFGLGLPIAILVCARRLLKTPLQRQYLYVLLATQAHLLILGAGANGIFADYSVHDAPCRVLGFLTQWASITELIFTFSIIVFLHGAILHHHASRKLLFCRGWIDKVDGPRTRLVLEALFVALSVLSPPAIDWLPFRDHAYGLSGAWCWIVSLNGSENCTDTGFAYQMGLQYVPVFFVSAVCVALTVLTNVILCLAACRHKDTSRHHKKRAKETMLLLLCIVLSFSLVMPEIATRTIMHMTRSAVGIPYLVYMLYAAGTPLGRLVLSFDLFLYLYPPSGTAPCGRRGMVFRRRCCHLLMCCKKRYNLLDLDVEEDDEALSSDMPGY